MNAANERINIINVIILEYRVRIDPLLLYYTEEATSHTRHVRPRYAKSAIVNGSLKRMH